MRSLTLQAQLCLLAMALAPTWPAHAENTTEADNLLVAGSTELLWIIRRDTKAITFDLLPWRIGANDADQQWVRRGLRGNILRASAAGHRLNLFLIDPLDCLAFTPDGRMIQGAPPTHERWPKGAAPLALTDATGYGPAEGASILAVVPRIDPPPTPAEPVVKSDGEAIDSIPPQEAPASSLRGSLACFQTLDQQWQYICELPDMDLGEATTVFASARDNQLYLLLSDPAAADLQLWLWAQEQWRRLDLPDPVAPARPLLMAVLAGQVRMVLAAEATDGTTALTIATIQDDQTIHLQPVTRDGQEVLIPADGRLVGAALGDRVGLVRFHADQAELTFCEVNGSAEPPRPIEAFGASPLDQGGIAIDNVLGTALLVLLLAMFFLRRRGSLGEPPLPAELRIAPLDKRFVAGLIDFVPFVAIVTLATIYWALEREWITVEQLRQATTPTKMGKLITPVLQTWAGATIHIAGMGLYFAYNVVMDACFGATLGKKLLKLRVISVTGEGPTWLQAVYRNVPKAMIDRMPLLLIFPLFSPRRQRLGDVVGRTLVVTQAPLPLQPPIMGNHADREPDNQA